MIAAIFDSEADSGRALDELYRQGYKVTLLKGDEGTNLPVAANVSAPQTGVLDSEPAVAGISMSNFNLEELQYYRQTVGNNGVAIFVEADDEAAVEQIFKKSNATRVDYFE